MKLAIGKLIANPGSFDGIMMPLIQTLNSAIKEEQTLTTIIEEIFTQVFIPYCNMRPEICCHHIYH